MATFTSKSGNTISFSNFKIVGVNYRNREHYRSSLTYRGVVVNGLFSNQKAETGQVINFTNRTN